MWQIFACDSVGLVPQTTRESPSIMILHMAWCRGPWEEIARTLHVCSPLHFVYSIPSVMFFCISEPAGFHVSWLTCVPSCRGIKIRCVTRWLRRAAVWLHTRRHWAVASLEKWQRRFRRSVSWIWRCSAVSVLFFSRAYGTKKRQQRASTAGRVVAVVVWLETQSMLAGHWIWLCFTIMCSWKWTPTVLSLTQAPVQRVCGWDTPFPLTNEPFYVPDKLRCFEAIKKVIEY